MMVAPTGFLVRRWLGLTRLALVFTLWPGAAAGDFVRATVTGLSVSDQHESSTSTSATVTENGATGVATASVSVDLSSDVSADGEAADLFPISQVTAVASFTGFYTLQGLPGGASVPLSFNVGFERNYACETAPGLPISIAAISIFQDVHTPAFTRRACQLACQAGLPILSSTSCNVFANVFAKLTPMVRQEAAIIHLTNRDGLDIELPFPVPHEVPLFTTDYAALAALIVAAIETFGIPRLNIGPTTLDVGLRAEIVHRSRDRHEVVATSPSGILKVGTTAGVSARGPGAIGTAVVQGSSVNPSSAAGGSAEGSGSSTPLILDTALESVTVPKDFDAFDISDLDVVFDSGLVVPVQRETDCSDGLDNDGDGLIDFPQDGGCEHPFAASEGFSVPMLGTWGIGLLIFLLSTVALSVLRRREAALG